MAAEERDWFKEDIRNVVDEPEWQRLRISFLGTWKKTPEENVQKLRDFLGPVDQATDRRLRTVWNYLTGSGMRTKTISHPSIDKLLAEVRAEAYRRREKDVKC